VIGVAFIHDFFGSHDILLGAFAVCGASLKARSDPTCSI
jgi:hypothetical protein